MQIALGTDSTCLASEGCQTPLQGYSDTNNINNGTDVFGFPRASQAELPPPRSYSAAALWANTPPTASRSGTSHPQHTTKMKPVDEATSLADDGGDGDGDDPNRLAMFLPDTDISFDVIAADLASYLGRGASMSRGALKGTAGYMIKSLRMLNVKMIRCLKQDSKSRSEEQRHCDIAVYILSKTHRNRLENPPAGSASNAAGGQPISSIRFRSERDQRKDRPRQCQRDHKTGAIQFEMGKRIF